MIIAFILLLSSSGRYQGKTKGGVGKTRAYLRLRVKRQFFLWIGNLTDGGSEYEAQKSDHDSGYGNYCSL
jgi:hypothetical protein